MLLLSLTVAGAVAVSAGSVGTYEYWPVLTVPPNTARTLFVVVSNPDAGQPANVEISNSTGPVQQLVLAANSSESINLGNSQAVGGSELLPYAYRVQSDIPIQVSQQLSFDLVAGSQCAGLVPQSGALGREYLTIGYGGSFKGSAIAVVAATSSEVTIVPAADTRAGTTIPALAAGVAYTFQLSPFDVLQLTTTSFSGDLSGTYVRASEPVGVLAACLDCIIGSSAADRMDEWVLPIRSLGSEYIAPACSSVTGDDNFWRVLATVDGTTVTTDPVVSGTPVLLDRGQFVDLVSRTSFGIRSTEPVLASRINAGGATYSDPAQTSLLPEKLFFRAAAFGLPTDVLFGRAWVDVVARPGTSVVVDGVAVPVAQFVPVGATGFEHAQVMVGVANVHHSIVADSEIAAYASFADSAMMLSFPVSASLPPDLAPSCNAGGPYVIDCSGPETGLALDGSGSSDPEGLPLGFAWSSPFAELSFQDPSLMRPNARIRGVGTFGVDLSISDGVNVSTCSTTVTSNGDSSVPLEICLPSRPLWLARAASGILFSWEDAGGVPMSTNVYEGTIGQAASHLPLACNEAGTVQSGGRRESILAPSAGSRYYLIAAANCAEEGPTGSDPARSTCPP